MTRPWIASRRLSRSSTAHCVITPGAPGLRADQQRHGVERRVARHADRRLAFGEAAQRGLGRVGREQRRVLLEVRDVRLVGGRAPGAQALEREHHLDRRAAPTTRASLAGVRPRASRTSSARGHVDVDEHPRERRVGERHRLGSDVEIDAVGRDEAIERVEALARLAVELADDTVLDHERRRGVAGAVHGHEAERRLGPDQRLAPERRLARTRKRSLRGSSLTVAARNSPRSAITTAASRTNAAQRGAPTSASAAPIASSSAAVARRGRRRGVDGEHLVVGQRGELGGSLEVLGQLLPAGRACHGRLAQQRLRRRAQLVGRDAAGAQAVQRDLRERRAAGCRDELGPPLPERVVDERIHALRLPPSGDCYTRLQ